MIDPLVSLAFSIHSTKGAFCGAGGTSTGMLKADRDLEKGVKPRPCIKICVFYQLHIPKHV